MNHHHTVSLIARTDRTMLFINNLLLLTVAFLPFPTKLVARLPPRRRRAGGRARLRRDARRDGDPPPVLVAVRPPQPAADRRRDARLALRAVDRAYWPGVPMYAAVFVVAFFSPLAAVFITFAIAAFYLPSAALFDR